MQDLVFISFTIFVTIGLIYFVYKFILGIDMPSRDDELQITESDLLEQLNLLYRDRNYYIIENLAKKYLEKKFANDEVRLILARSLFESGKFYDAIEQARIISRHKPEDFEIKNFIVNCYLNASKPLEAINMLKEILETDSSNAVVIKELAQVYLDTNQKISARKMYEQLEDLVASNQEKVKIKNMVAQIYIEFKEFDGAVRKYQEILEIYPDNLQIKKNLVALYKLQEDYERETELVNEIYESHLSNEDDIWALQSLSDIYLQNRNYEKALEYAKLAEQLPSANKIKIRKVISEILIKLDQVDDSIDILKNLVDENPANSDLKKSLAKAYQAKDDFESAIGIYEMILENANADDIAKIRFEISTIYSAWALYLFDKNLHEECFKKFNTALEYDSENAELYYRLGQINKKIKNYNEAITQFKTAIEHDETNGNYYFALAECYEIYENTFEQKKMLLKAAECNKEEDNAIVYYNLALLCESQNDLVKAIEYLEKAISINPNDTNAKYRYALILEHKGENDKAINLYKEILELDPTYKEAENNLKLLSSNF